MVVVPAPSSRPPLAHRLGGLIAAVTALWGAAAAAGTVWAIRYQMTPAGTGEVSEVWPSDSGIAADDRPTLAMFIHPRCSCSRASLDEALHLAGRVGDRASIHVYFFVPDTEPEGWERTDLWHSAAKIPGATLHVDRGGRYRNCFGVRASGEVLLYAPDGSLHFHGGITAGRGHRGDNDGRRALEQLILDGATAVDQTPVFGCSLGTPSPTSSTCCRDIDGEVPPGADR